MNDQPGKSERQRQRAEDSRTFAMMVIALALTVLAGAAAYTTWFDDDRADQLAEDNAYHLCLIANADSAGGQLQCQIMYRHSWKP